MRLGETKPVRARGLSFDACICKYNIYIIIKTIIIIINEGLAELAKLFLDH